MKVNKTYRIRTNVGTNDYISLDANLVQDYDTFEILSVSLDSVDTYKLHNSNYGVVVGRVLANNGFGIPNAKVSVFIQSDSEDGTDMREVYPFTSSMSKDRNGIRYNLLPDEKVSDCHQVVGTFPNKRYALDNDVILEVFDKYYKYTTRTNNSGDYLICGVPTGAHTLHMDLDLSDCGILSQRPRDFVYKGYTVEQFENPNMFKNGTEYSNLSQIFTQDQSLNVVPFWGNESLGETIGITRADINVAFKFEPTCVFLGSVASDNASQGISKKCIPTPHMGDMDELTTGEGTIEMIRKTPGGSVEEFQVKGTQLINENGIWCYQIPMNLDYMMTDEYGNMVPTDNPDKGIPTRARVRFRISMQDNEQNTDNFFRAKALVPHNPQNLENGKFEDYDYEFGTFTREDSFRDLFWNNVYSVKSYIPRFQKKRVQGWKEDKFTGIKHCNYYGANNPIPYNNMRIKLPFMFVVMCIIIKLFIRITSLVNWIIVRLANILADMGNTKILGWYPFEHLYDAALEMKLNVIDEGMCPDLENWYFAPVFKEDSLWGFDQKPPRGKEPYDLLKQTLRSITDVDESAAEDDPKSIARTNGPQKGGKDGEDVDGEAVCLTIKTDYLISCLEMNLAQEYRVINFDFYNDWINGLIYFPRWMRYVRPKKKFLGITWARSKVKGCMDDTKIFSKSRVYTQVCALPYSIDKSTDPKFYNTVGNPVIGNNRMHKSKGYNRRTIFGANGGICHEKTTKKGQFVYYLKPCEWVSNADAQNIKVNLFATDIILLGSLNDCDLNGIPQSFKHLSSSSYIMPTNLALTNMDTNGPLYAIDGKSICAGGSQTPNTTESMKSTRVDNVDIAKNGLSSELDYYGAAGEGSSYNIHDFDNDEPADTIAITEAAGVSWNWTGPGQGKADKSSMYYPGGHFLGISCVNSETNVKSCVNLSRICEAGATMSQRKEDPRVIMKDGTMLYTYTVPTGFISGDEVIDTDFRTMFATMNHNRLLATRTNPETGYKTYDFSYLRPSNFEGSLKNIIDDEFYNTKIGVEDESAFLSKLGIMKSDKRDDNDAGETNYTQTKTIEGHNIDYYMFRFGLNYNNLSTSDQLQKRKFLKNDNGYLYMPQYENSYYFYFGMKYGATSLDEFNKQFFSECETTSLFDGQPSMELVVSEYHYDDGTADVTVITENLETDFEYIKYYNNARPDIIKEDTTDLSKEMFTISDLDFGTWTFVVRDANGIEVSKSIEIGTNMVSADVEIFDFNISEETRPTGEPTIYQYQGGYAKISNIKVDFLDAGSEITIRLKAGDEVEQSVPARTESADAYILCANSANTLYTISVFMTDSSVYKSYDLPITNVTFKNTASVDLKIGNRKYSVSYLKDFKSKVGNGSISYGIPEWLSTPNLKDDSMWIYREAFFKGEPDGAPHNNLFFTNSGSKVLWGTPQNKDGFGDINKLYCSENITELPSGFVLDDENVFQPTYGAPITKCKPFSILSYNGTTVCGDYIGRITDNIVYIIDTGKNTTDIGIVYKDIDNNELYFGPIVEDTEVELGVKIANGIIFVAIPFATIKRPFKAEANFIEWIERQVTMSTGADGIQTPSVIDEVEKGKIEVYIHNGVTYGTYFSEDSKISGYEGRIGYTGDNNDMSGATNGEDRIITINDFVADKTITSYGYNIKEGYPTDKDGAEDLTHSISKYASPTFYNNIYYFTEGIATTTFIAGDGETSDDSIKYYLCQNTNGLFNGETYVYNKVDNTYYAEFTFEAAAGKYNKEGASVFVTITPSSIYSFKYINDEDVDDTYTGIIPFAVTDSNIDDAIKWVGENNAKVKAVTKHKIDTTPRRNWMQMLENDILKPLTSIPSTVSPAVYGEWYIIGVYNDGDFNIVRIYNNLKEIIKPDVPTIEAIKVNGVSTLSISEPCDVVVTSQNGLQWGATSDGTNVKIDPSTNTDGKPMTSMSIRWDDSATVNETITIEYSTTDETIKSKKATINIGAPFKISITNNFDEEVSVYAGNVYPLEDSYEWECTLDNEAVTNQEITAATVNHYVRVETEHDHGDRIHFAEVTLDKITYAGVDYAYASPTKIRLDNGNNYIIET